MELNNAFKVKVRNWFREKEKELVVYSSQKKKIFPVAAESEILLDIPRVSDEEDEHYLLISISPGAGMLLSSKVEVPSQARLTFIPAERIDTTICRCKNGVFLKIPECPPTWLLKITAPPQDAVSTSQLRLDTNNDGPDTVSAGEDEGGG